MSSGVPWRLLVPERERREKMLDSVTVDEVLLDDKRDLASSLFRLLLIERFDTIVLLSLYCQADWDL